jgi:hypothetical protein
MVYLSKPCTSLYEIPKKSLKKYFKGSMTIEFGHNLMRVAHKVSDHHHLHRKKQQQVATHYPLPSSAPNSGCR